MPTFHEFKVIMGERIGSVENKIYVVEDIDDEDEVNDVFERLEKGENDGLEYEIDVEDVTIAVEGHKVIDIEDIHGWNQSDREDCTTLWYEDGLTSIVVMGYEEFTELMEDYGYEVGRSRQEEVDEGVEEGWFKRFCNAWIGERGRHFG
jgi:hypothetical protein